MPPIIPTEPLSLAQKCHAAWVRHFNSGAHMGIRTPIDDFVPAYRKPITTCLGASPLLQEKHVKKEIWAAGTFYERGDLKRCAEKISLLEKLGVDFNIKEVFAKMLKDRKMPKADIKKAMTFLSTIKIK